MTTPRAPSAQQSRRPPAFDPCTALPRTCRYDLELMTRPRPQMSCYEWEAGELLLPTVAVKPLRDQLNKAHNAHRTAIMAAVKTLSTTLRATRGTKTVQVDFVIQDAITAAYLRNADELTGDLLDVLGAPSPPQPPRAAPAGSAPSPAPTWTP